MLECRIHGLDIPKYIFVFSILVFSFYSFFHRHLRTNPLDKYGVLLAYNIRPEPLDRGLLASQIFFFAHSENGEHATK